jgi:hypothetical protein
MTKPHCDFYDMLEAFLLLLFQSSKKELNHLPQDSTALFHLLHSKNVMNLEAVIPLG